MRRRAARVDENQGDIVDALRAIGCSVAPTSTAGDGFPDLVVGDRGRNYLIEIKDGDKPPSRRVLTQDQIDFHSTWHGQICVICTVAEAIVFITRERKHHEKN